MVNNEVLSTGNEVWYGILIVVAEVGRAKNSVLLAPNPVINKSTMDCLFPDNILVCLEPTVLCHRHNFRLMSLSKLSVS